MSAKTTTTDADLQTIAAILARRDRLLRDIDTILAMIDEVDA